MNVNEKVIEEALQLVLSGELEAEDTALAEVSSVRSYEDAGLLTRDNGIVLRMADGSEFQIRIIQSR